MYEAEVNRAIESSQTIPPDVLQRFTETRESVVARTTLPWGEHCTECVWPHCYFTCELYTPRTDGACRQFIDGMVRVDVQGGVSPYLLKLRFKSWAKLWTVGNLELQSISEATMRERRNMAVGAVGRNLPVPAPVKLRVLRKIGYLRRRSAEEAAPTANAADCFMLECFNPDSDTVTLTLSIRARRTGGTQFQERVQLEPGFTRIRVPMHEIEAAVSLGEPFEVEIAPNGANDTVLFFGLIDFVKERPSSRATPQDDAGRSVGKWKCVVWDLDNTLWEGVLVERGASGVQVRDEVVAVIRELDQRGILHSIASKNDYDEVVKVLGRLGLDQYFLHPQISWGPKSVAIGRIAKLLNIGLDSVAFVDDQAFEREEVRTALPQVEVVDAAAATDLVRRPECEVPVTAESRTRRAMYREQEQRQSALDAAAGDYVEFLRGCRMVATVAPLDGDNLRRVYELAQRTNQLNFSGNRYSEEQLRQIIANPELATFVIGCSDRFGDYGIIGFAIVARGMPQLLDLMFSCRVQSKRVEHAILSYLLREFSEAGRDFYANYRRTVKNGPAGRVFEDVGFEPTGEADGVTTLVFRRGRAIPEDGILRIEARAAQGVAVAPRR